MKLRSSFAKTIAACLVLVAIPLLLAAQSIDNGTFLVSGLIGLSRGQAASLNVTNSSREVKEVRFYFLDIDGRLLKSSGGRVLPGQSMAMVLSHSELRDPTGRVQVRGLVRFVDPPDPDADPPTPDADPPSPDSDPPSELVISSLEVFDEASGKTSFSLLLPAIRGANIYLPVTDIGVREEQR